MKDRTGYVCDFCGKSKAEVEIMVVNGSSAICCECVEESQSFIAIERDRMKKDQ